MKNQSGQNKSNKLSVSSLKAGGVRIVKTLFTFEYLFLGAALWAGLNDIQSGILVLILWQLIRLNDRKTS